MKIVFFIKDSSGVVLRDFSSGIIAFLRREHEVRLSDTFDESSIAQLCRWADLAFVEWMAEHAVAVSRHRRPCKVLVRLHSYEAYTVQANAIRWENVDLLVSVAGHVLALLESRIPDLKQRVRTRIIPNGLDVSRFPAKPPAPRGKRIAWVGTLRHTKNFPLMLQCLRAVCDRDPGWTLHVAGDYPAWNGVESMENMVYNLHMIEQLGLRDQVTFCGNVEDMPGWYRDKDALVSTSIRESFGYAIAEAMATGLQPVVHAFPGAQAVWPRECLFYTVAQCADMLVAGAYDPKALRAFVTERYGLAKQLATWAVTLGELADTPSAPAEETVAVADAADRFPGVAGYWENRYADGGTSGAGSYGRLAAFKARVLNAFVAEQAVGSVVEFGCGDGNQLALAAYPAYVGLDITAGAVALCRERHGRDLTKRFFRYEPEAFPADNPWLRGELALSLDVIFHIVEDRLYELYLGHLFDSASRYVIIYSSNTEADSGVAHVRHRKFTGWVRRNRRDFVLEGHIPNAYPFDPGQPDTTSFSDFYIFKRTEAHGA